MTSGNSTHQGIPGGDGSVPSHSNSDPAGAGDDLDPADKLVPDPVHISAPCDEARFTSILEQLVADDAPRVFAVVQEYGTRLDAWIAAWGMAFDDHAEVVSVEGDMRMSLQPPNAALLGFHDADEHIHARLVWFNPDAVTPVENDEGTKANEIA